jgi:hypothetical protein
MSCGFTLDVAVKGFRATLQRMPCSHRSAWHWDKRISGVPRRGFTLLPEILTKQWPQPILKNQSAWKRQECKILQKCRSHLKVLGARRIPRSKFHTVDPQISQATVQNLVAIATWRPRFVHRWLQDTTQNSITCHRQIFKPNTSLTGVKCAFLCKPARLSFLHKAWHTLNVRNLSNRPTTRVTLCKWHPVLPTAPKYWCKKVAGTTRTIHCDMEWSNRPRPETRLFPWQWPSGFTGARRDPRLSPTIVLPVSRLSIVLWGSTFLGHGETKQTRPSQAKVLCYESSNSKDDK